MKFVALVSGGKDSCFNILHSQLNGHELVALANLYPAEDKEIDSYMYQTVGHTVLSHYERCTQVPMFRRQISGSSKNVELQYQLTLEDETEDLHILLQQVKTAHPDLQAVSVGAILSSYQRIRVENVCFRLGLVSLSYLWQRNQDELMQEMCGSTMDARLIKVAAYGLDQSQLGLSLKQAYPILKKLNSQFDVHICGEGGEFETIVLDAPFFKDKKIKIVDQKVVNHTNSGDVFYLQLSTDLADKSPETVDWKLAVHRRPVLTSAFQDLYDAVEVQKTTVAVNQGKLEVCDFPTTLVKHLGDKLYISNLQSDKLTLEEQTEDIFARLDSILEKNNISSTAHIITVNLLLSDMSDFVKINSIYTKQFLLPLPPSRTCVQTVLPSQKYLSLSCIAVDDINQKSGLHVQSRSYWAPANIGPYSQAIVSEVSKLANLAGQIPLIPATMELATEESLLSYGQPGPIDILKLNTLLSLQHFDTVMEAVNCTSIGGILCYTKDQVYIPYAAETFKELNRFLEDEKFIEPSPRSLLIAVVSDMPRSAPIEWSGVTYDALASNNLSYSSDSSGEESDVSQFESKFGSNAYRLISKYKTLKVNRGEFIGVLWFQSLEVKVLNKFLSHDFHYNILANPTVLGQLETPSSFEFTPVKAVYNFEGKKVDIGVVIRGSL